MGEIYPKSGGKDTPGIMFLLFFSYAGQNNTKKQRMIDKTKKTGYNENRQVEFIYGGIQRKNRDNKRKSVWKKRHSANG